VNIYKIINDDFSKISQEHNWYNPDEFFFITCEGHEMPLLVPVFGFDPSTIEECLSVDQYIKSESFDGYDFTTFNYIDSIGVKLKQYEINIYASRNYIIFVFDRKISALCEMEKQIIGKKLI
jgi:magnesium transporter